MHNFSNNAKASSFVEAELELASFWREEISASARTWDRAGCEALVASAAKDFEAATGVSLPWNLHIHGRWVSRAHGRSFPLDGRGPLSHEGEACLSEAARFAGWLRAAADHPPLVHLISRCTSDRGFNSLATTLNLYRLYDRYSPGAASRRLQAIRRRANEILAPTGSRVSWRALGYALERAPRATGKAATVAAATTLTGVSPSRGYKANREALMCRLRTVNHTSNDLDL